METEIESKITWYPYDQKSTKHRKISPCILALSAWKTSTISNFKSWWTFYILNITHDWNQDTTQTILIITKNVPTHVPSSNKQLLLNICNESEITNKIKITRITIYNYVFLHRVNLYKVKKTFKKMEKGLPIRILVYTAQEVHPIFVPRQTTIWIESINLNRNPYKEVTNLQLQIFNKL